MEGLKLTAKVEGRLEANLRSFDSVDDKSVVAKVCKVMWGSKAGPLVEAIAARRAECVSSCLMAVSHREILFVAIITTFTRVGSNSYFRTMYGLLPVLSVEDAESSFETVAAKFKDAKTDHDTTTVLKLLNKRLCVLEHKILDSFVFPKIEEAVLIKIKVLIIY